MSMFKVRATRPGRYKRKKIKTGQVFMVDEKDFLGPKQKHLTKDKEQHVLYDGWMERVSDDEPEGLEEDEEDDIPATPDKGAATATDAIDRANAKTEKRTGKQKKEPTSSPSPAAPAGPKPPKGKPKDEE